MDSVLREALELYKEDCDAVSEMHREMLDDLRFSNPSNPDQWDAQAKIDRAEGRRLTLDNTNQYIMQVVNDCRQNKSDISVLPVDGKADIAVAEQLNGIIRHIEYQSRADIAYDTALELAARIGQGWIRIVPEVVRPETNEQEIRITRIHDPFSVKIDCNSTEPDGSDAMRGWVETRMSERAFKRKYPKANIANWKNDTDGWFSQDSVRLCEYFSVQESSENRIILSDSGDDLSESDYWDRAKKEGKPPKYHGTFKKRKRKVMLRVLSGVEVLEETEYPSRWIGLVPVIGHELWIEGKRHLCGMVRGLKGGQRFHNIQMSALAEALLSQPKAPFLVPDRGMEGLEEHWKALASANPAYLPYRDMDNDGNPIAAPQRQSPPMFPVGFANGARLGQDEMQAAVGMYRSNLGAPSNAVSGRAKIQDQKEGDTANFHYIDNLRRSKEHVGRIVVDMIPRIYDTLRQARILGEDGQQSSVIINPDMAGAVKFKRNDAGQNTKKVQEINPSVGSYDVRVKIGPSYTTMRQETAERLAQFAAGNPVLQAAFAPLIMKMNDLPDAEKVMKIALATLPPEIQKAYQGDDEAADIPPQIAAQMRATQAQMQQMGQMIQQLQAQLQQNHEQSVAAQQKNQIDLFKAQTDAQAKAAELESRRRELAIQEFSAETDRIKVTGEVPSIQQQIAEFAALADQHAQAMQANHESVIGAINHLAQSHDALANHVMAPPQIIRGPDGRAVGIQKGNVTLSVVRDDGGQVTGAVPTSSVG